MKKEIKHYLPEEIEKRSFEIIEEELTTEIDEKIKPIVKRVIHTTADFSYEETMIFSENAVDKAIEALTKGAQIITDTNMAKSGINKGALKKLGCSVDCFIADEEVAAKAKLMGTTRAAVSVLKAAEEFEGCIYVVGNAPTALIEIYKLVEEGKFKPSLIIGVPVGFVNVVESKELITELDIPYIIAKGRKGGSNVAAAIVNGLMYMAGGR